MGLDRVAASTGDLGDDAGQPAVLDPARPTAARADDVMMVGRRAGHVRMLAARQVQTLDHMKLRQQVERPKEGRPAESEPPATSRRLEIGGREVAVVLRDQIGHGATRSGQPVAGLVKRVDDGIGGCHSAMICDFVGLCRE